MKEKEEKEANKPKKAGGGKCHLKNARNPMDCNQSSPTLDDQLLSDKSMKNM